MKTDEYLEEQIRIYNEEQEPEDYEEPDEDILMAPHFGER